VKATWYYSAMNLSDYQQFSDEEQQLRLYIGDALAAMTIDRWELVDERYGLQPDGTLTGEIVVRRPQYLNVPPESSKIYARLVVTRFMEIPVLIHSWYAYPVATPKGDFPLIRGLRQSNFIPGYSPERVTQWLRGLEDSSSGADWKDILGDPATTVSVFALVATFIGGILGQASKDAYQALKQKIQHAPEMQNSSGEKTVELYDPELRTILECPPEIPAEAAAQLASMDRSQLCGARFHWSSTTRSWERVGEIVGSSEWYDIGPME
jgi:hypothetical protein